MICPDCSGKKQLFAFWDGQDNAGRRTSGHGFVPCFTCEGAGEITDEHAARIEAGKQLRAERIARGASLMDEAKRLGLTPAQLSARERGE